MSSSYSMNRYYENAPIATASDEIAQLKETVEVLLEKVNRLEAAASEHKQVGQVGPFTIQFSLLRVHDGTKSSTARYEVVHGSEQYVSAVMHRKMKVGDNIQEILCIKYPQNAGDFYELLKNELDAGRNVITGMGNYIGFHRDSRYSEKQLIADIRAIHAANFV